MAFLFVIYIPNEDLDGLGSLGFTAADDTDAAAAVTTSKAAAADVAESLDDEVQDDAEPEKPLLGDKDKLNHLDPKNRTKHGSLAQIDANRNEQRRTSVATVSNADGSSKDVTDASTFVLKGDKVRFEVTTLPKNHLTTDGANPVSIEMSSGSSGVQLSKVPSKSCIEKTSADYMSDDDLEVITERLTLKEALIDIIDSFGIVNDVWEKSADETFWSIQFVIEEGRSEQILHRLLEFGFGYFPDTSVSTFPANVNYKNSGSDKSCKDIAQKEKRERSEFMKSVKSRLTVAQVVLAVQSNAMLTFDYLVLIGLASIIAGLGLAENSSVVLVASMLISPLMGPIVGFTFGIIIKNSGLYKMSVRNELIGLSVCLTIGFLFGLITGGVNNAGAYWGPDSWPTQEMQARGLLRSLWVGILIALPSGAGVALSILGGNTGSLVGVAISASLLPPAVNAGMLWGLALVSACAQQSVQPTDIPLPNLNCSLANNNYKFVYSCHMPTEAAILGCVSLLLTIVNIICIFIAGIIVLKIKEITPHSAFNQQTERFWKKDISIARDTYRTVKGSDTTRLGSKAKLLIAEMQLKPSDSTEINKELMEEVANDPVYMNVKKSMLSPGPDILKEMSFEQHYRKNRTSAFEPTVIDNHYLTVGDVTMRRQLLKQIQKVPLTPQPSSATPHFQFASGYGGGGAVVRLRRRNAAYSAVNDNILLVDIDQMHHLEEDHKHRRSMRRSYHPNHSFEHEHVWSPGINSPVTPGITITESPEDD